MTPCGDSFGFPGCTINSCPSFQVLVRNFLSGLKPCRTGKTNMANGSLLFTASCKNAHLLADWPQKIQKIFVANQEPALARPFGSGPL